MKAKHTCLIFLVLSILFLLASYLFSLVESSNDLAKVRGKNVQNRFSIAINKANNVLNLVKSNSLDINATAASTFLKEGIHTYAYYDSALIFWSDNKIPLADLLYLETDKVYKIGSNWIYLNKLSKDSFQYVVALEIKSEYNVSNRYLTNGFNPSLQIPRGSKITMEPNNKSIAIKGAKGNDLFYLKINALSYNRVSLILSGGAYALFYVFWFLSIYIALVIVLPFRFKLSMSGVFFLVTLAIILIINNNLPDAIKGSGLYNPRVFASSKIFSSLALLMLCSITLFVIVYVNAHYVFPRIQLNKLSLGQAFILPVLGIFIIGYLFSTSRSIIYDSSISLIPNNVSELTIYSVIGYLIIALNIFSLVFFLQVYVKIIVKANTHIHTRLSVIFFVLLLAGLFALYFTDILFAAVFVLLLGALFAFYYARGKNTMNLVQTGLMLVVVTVLMEYVILNATDRKEQLKKEVIALDYAYEHDYVAEVLLAQFDRQIINDTNLISLIYNTSFTYEDIYAYLKKNYFNSFWSKYDFQVTICNRFDEVFVSVPDEEWYPCYHFFDNLYKGRKEQVENSNFNYINNHNGRITYFGALPIPSGNKEQITLFIELNSKPFTRSLGYPELLLDEKVKKYNRYEGFSLAKYYQSKLVSSIGEYPYSLTSDNYPIRQGVKEYFVLDDYQHLIYYYANDVVVLVSVPVFSVVDKFITFSYLFLFNACLLVLILFVFNFQYLRSSLKINFQRKIQLSILTVSMIAFMLIGGATVFYSIIQYRQKHFENISEKMRSVYIELDHKLSLEDELTEYWVSERYDNLRELLIKFSDVFYTDINLYYPNGKLMATSRLEIYEQGMVSQQMNRQAFEKMAYEKKPEYIHFEKIGKMRFLSGYVPFFNYDNQLLGYLNLPYFAFQNLLRTDVVNLLVTVINIYALIILITLALGFLLSQQVTFPLRFLQEKFREMNVGKKNQIIEYKGKDEIADIVGEYNRMVVELEKSIELLGRQERELAWKEMAKQIAHEIKNPLTPMKLSVQHLLRTIKDSPEKIEEKIKKVSESLIQQIDNLSSIATAFSNFAKMPDAKMEPIDLLKIIRSIENLFESDDKVQFAFNYHVLEQAIIYGDEEQLTRVFTNLVKNAIQAIPHEKKGEINITVLANKENYAVKISDNGTGISEELKDKLFEPNFTTKSGGMGLGLAIVKKIVENSSGKIYFASEQGVGTTFTVELPKV